MKIIGIIEIDLGGNPIGLKNRCLDEFLGVPVLRHMVNGAKRIKSLSGICIICRTADEPDVRRATEGMGCYYAVSDGVPDIPHRRRLRAGRKWALSSWQGGIGNSTVFCEEGNPSMQFLLAQNERADAVLKLPSAAPIVDSLLAQSVVERFCGLRDKVDFIITGAPAGFNYECISTEYLGKLAAAKVTLGDVLGVRKDMNIPEPTVQEFFMRLEEKIFSCNYRFTYDSCHHVDFLKSLSGIAGDNIHNMTCRELIELADKYPHFWRGSLPREIDVEIATDTDVCSVFMPLAGRAKQFMPVRIFRSLVDDLARADDVKISFCGHGEPLLHPDLAEMIGYAKQKGIYGTHLVTNGILLDEQYCRKLLDAGVDVVSVSMDAFSGGTYKNLYGVDKYSEVVKNVETLLEMRAKKGQFLPFVTAEFTKVRENVGEMESFVNYWLGKADRVVLRGFNDYAGQVEDRSLMHLMPGVRELCMKLQNRMTIHADGMSVMCGQDFSGKYVAGDVRKQSAGDIWNGRFYEELREAHMRGDYGANAFCGQCKNWGFL